MLTPPGANTSLTTPMIRRRMRRKSPQVMGISAPAPRITPRAIALGVTLVGLPLLAVLVAIDIAIWLAVKLIWGGCYGLWCWI